MSPIFIQLTYNESQPSTRDLPTGLPMVETFIIYTPKRQVKGRNRTKENNLDTYKGSEAKGNGAIQKI